MKIRTRLLVLAFVLAVALAAVFAHPAFAQDAQMPSQLEQQLGGVLDVDVPAPATASLMGRDRFFQAALARDVSARLDAALVPPVRLGTVVARRAAAAGLSAQSSRRVLYAAR